MGTAFYIGCPRVRDRFELGSGAWGWHYTPDPNDYDQPKTDPSIARLLEDRLHRTDRDAFAGYVLRVWLSGHVEPGDEEWIREVGLRLFDYCARRRWEVVFIPEECTAHPDWYDWPIVDSRYDEALDGQA